MTSTRTVARCYSQHVDEERAPHSDRMVRMAAGRQIAVDRSEGANEPRAFSLQRRVGSIRGLAAQMGLTTQGAR